MSSKDSKSSPPVPPPGAKSSGRVTHDARGNPVWEWQTSTGVFEKDVSTQRLEKLEAKGLSLMDTQKVVKQKSKDGEAADQEANQAKRLSGGGMNPYDNSGKQSSDSRPRVEFDSSRHHPAIAHKQQVMHKEPPRQSLQTKYHGKAKSEAKPKGFLDKIKDAFGSGKK